MNPEPKKDRTLFIVFALGFLAVLASGNAVLSSMQLDEMAAMSSAATANALAESSQGISQELPADPMAVASSVGVFDEKALATGTAAVTSDKTVTNKTLTKPAAIPR